MHTTDIPPERYDFLDWLRVIAIFVLFFFHTGMIFVGWGWHVVNEQTILALAWPMDIAHRLRMPLLFVIAGAGMRFALRRRTAGHVLRERTRKLLLPLVVGMFLIVPPQIYAERLLRGQWHGGYLDFFVTQVLQFHPYPAGDFSWHHLWFIAYLYVYVVLLLPAMLWWKERGPHIAPGLWLFVLGLPLGINEVLLKPSFPETHNLISDWYIFNHYLLLTIYGYVLACMPGAWKWLSDVRAWSLALGAGSIALLIALFKVGVVPHDSAVDYLWANLLTWFCVMAFLGYGYRYLSFSNRLLAWARDASYPIYILHQTAIVLIGYAVVQQAWTPWVKYVVVLVLSLVACLALYQGCIRHVPLLRLFFGMKRERRPVSGPVRGTALEDVQ